MVFEGELGSVCGADCVVARRAWTRFEARTTCWLDLGVTDRTVGRYVDLPHLVFKLYLEGKCAGSPIKELNEHP